MRTTITLERAIGKELQVPAKVVQQFDSFAHEVYARSTIAWGEHCSECAVPICYSTCNFYSPRADLTCRRFISGIESIANAANLRRIRFRKWGKLEGNGPVRVRSLKAVERSARADAIFAWWIEKAPLPFRLKRHVAWRWNRRVERSAARLHGTEPTAFAIEAWSVGGQTHQFTVTFLEKPGKKMFQERFTIGPEYCRLVIPLKRVAANLDLSRPYLIQVEPVGEVRQHDVVFGICDFVLMRNTSVIPPLMMPPQASRKRAKVVVWDLDNTLWEGTLAEDGFSGIVLKPEAVKTLLELDRRGILNSIASKNSEAEAIAALKKFGIADYFIHPQISWGPKSEAIERIAKLLDLGLDTFVFIDDQPFERGEVQEAHRDVTVLPETVTAELPFLEICDVPITAESGTRRSMYQAEERRAETFQTSGTNYLNFLASSRIVLEVRPLDATDWERIYELSQRTNQLNFFGTKYAREDVKAMVHAESQLHTFVMRCSDRFGEYGVIGFAAVDLAQGCIADFFMSCRVQRKYVEHAFFALLAAKLQNAGLDKISVRFRPTDRNGAAIEMLKDLGFSYEQSDSAAGKWHRSLMTGFHNSEIVHVLDRTLGLECKDQRDVLPKSGASS